MSIKINPDDLRKAARVAHIKDVLTTTATRNFWNTVDRLTLDREGRFSLKANDGVCWITWTIPYEGQNGAFDVLIPTDKLTEAGKYAGDSYELSLQGGVMSLVQGSRHAQIREQAFTDYPEPEFDLDSALAWKGQTKALLTALQFVGPFVDDKAPSPNKSVCSLDPERGTLRGGSPKRIATVTGLDIPFPMSFRQKTCKAITMFLSNIGDQVQVLSDGRHYLFQDDQGNELVILGENATFDIMTDDFYDQATDLFSVETKILLDSVKFLNGFMPHGSERIKVIVDQAGTEARMHLSTIGASDSLGDDVNSSDDLMIVRDTELTSGEPVIFSVTAQEFNMVLDALDPKGTVEMTYFKGLLMLEDISDNTEVPLNKSVLLAVQDMRRKR